MKTTGNDRRNTMHKVFSGRTPNAVAALAMIILMTFSLMGCSSAVGNGSAAGGAGSSATTALAETEASTAATTVVETTAAAETSETTVAVSAADFTEIRIAGLTGPTTMGMSKLISDVKDGTLKAPYTFTVAGTADEITPKLIKGELDIAAVPANLASVLYNNTKGEIRLLAVNTLGVLYIVEKGDSVQTFADLKGNTIYATGKGSAPEYGLRYLLKQNGMDPDADVTIEWKSEPAEIVAMLSTAEGGVAMMPQPFVTVAKGKVEGLRVAADLTAEWDALENGSQMITGVLVARGAFVDEHPEAVSAFLDAYAASTAFVNEKPAEAAAMIETIGIVPAAVAEKAIPACNITYVDGADMKSAMQGYLQVLFEQNPKSVGGAMPGDDFYFAR